jgi:sulfur carrier protein
MTVEYSNRKMINISLNNEPHQLSAATLLSDAIVQWGFGETKIAVAINGEFVPRSTYSSRELREGDQIDIVKPVGGG